MTDLPAKSRVQVTVFSFHVLGQHVECPEIARYKATREVIARLDGLPIAGTAETVDEDDLDSTGRYRRVNTGWLPLI